MIKTRNLKLRKCLECNGGIPKATKKKYRNYPETVIQCGQCQNYVMFPRPVDAKRAWNEKNKPIIKG